ncbi:EAL domain-containing protein [Marinomonas atlantica]|uniref:EAL domain-containing protein n=1 Tax=Marinomonas atlantica TaxID=1806668 RepID=UPI0018D2BB1A|nr:EAL domain-containing protein [Marinomonas atlantica]
MNSLDRFARAILGALLISFSPIGINASGNDVIGWFFAIFGIANIFSAITSWCFMYSLVGLTSLSSKEEDSDDQSFELDFKSIRKKALVGFGTVSILISAFFIGESYESGKATVQGMELQQLHHHTALIINEIEKRLNQEDLQVIDLVNTLSTITQEHFINDTKMFIAIEQANNNWVFDAKNIDQASQQNILEALKSHISNEPDHLMSPNIEHDFFHSIDSVEDYYYAINDKQYAITHHNFLAQKTSPIQIYVGELSLSSAHLIDSIISRMLISSVVVIWIALWGAVAVAFFIWKHVEGSNRRAIKAANTDSQTGLLNERALREIFSNDLTIQPSREYTVYAAKFRNLSQILATNSSIILTQVLQRLATRLKQEVDPECILGRLNDSTFVIITPVAKANCVNRFKQLINETQHLDNFQFSLEPTEVELSYPTDVSDFENLISSVSTLIYHANQQRLPYLRYQQHLIQNSQKVSQYSAALKTAIEEKQFELFLQPKVDMRTGDIVGAEALIRWNHPEDGLLSPYHFLDLVEQSNIRSSFALFVVNEVCRMALALQSAGYQLPLSLNLNGYDVFDPNVITTLEKVSKELLVQKHLMLEIELTESETALDVDHIATQLDYISNLGFAIALDDFGTGMSSFSYSHALPINTIKIDRSFVLNINDSDQSHIPIKAILFLAENYGYSVVVEGVETQQQVNILIELGCTVCQGYFYSKPITFDEFVTCLPDLH